MVALGLVGTGVAQRMKGSERLVYRAEEYRFG